MTSTPSKFKSNNDLDHSLDKNGELKCPLAEQWFKYKPEARLAMEKVGAIHSSIESITKYMSYLEKLNSIADTNERLVGAVIGKKQMPTAFGLGLLLLVGILMIVVLIKDSNLEVKLGANGISIGKGTTD